ncbi:MAG: hypothetical protein QOJ24_2632 [Mycobacterium sp.]|nr:hypothetical protein [Mycobacterium sp.]
MDMVIRDGCPDPGGGDSIYLCLRDVVAGQPRSDLRGRSDASALDYGFCDRRGRAGGRFQRGLVHSSGKMEPFGSGSRRRRGMAPILRKSAISSASGLTTMASLRGRQRLPAARRFKRGRSRCLAGSCCSVQSPGLRAPYDGGLTAVGSLNGIWRSGDFSRAASGRNLSNEPDGIRAIANRPAFFASRDERELADVYPNNA